MTRSMTGYGRAAGTFGAREISVEIRSVNQRGFEFAARMPRSMQFLEERVRRITAEYLTRGKAELSVSVGGESEMTVAANEQLARVYVDTVRKLAAELNLPDNLGARDLLRVEGLFAVTRPPEDEDALWSALEPVVREALRQHQEMRAREGERMCNDLIGKLDGIERRVAEIERRSPETVREYRERLAARMREVLADAAVDEARLLTEAALYADRAAVDEETVRLRSHIAQFRSMLRESETVGRKPDFLVQEMGREINTIGSKASDLAVTTLVLEMKNEMEKIREQVQNLE